MMNTDTPRLCGGTFFVLLLREKRRSRTKKQLQNFGSDGLTNVALMEHLIRLFDNTFIKPSGDSMDNRTSLYKKCELSEADCLPFDDDALIASFDKKVKNNYPALLFKMGEITDFFLANDNEAKMQELVFSVLTVIKDDSTILSEDSFYSMPDGAPIAKAALLSKKDLNLPSFLLGMWHYILMYRKDNTVGAATIESWHTAPQEKGDKHKFSSTIGCSFNHDIKISTDYESIDDAGQDIIEDTNEEPQVEDTTESIPTQTGPIVNQSIQNQFNFYQTGNGINIGHADKVEIKDGKVVNLK